MPKGLGMMSVREIDRGDLIRRVREKRLNCQRVPNPTLVRAEQARRLPTRPPVGEVKSEALRGQPLK